MTPRFSIYFLVMLTAIAVASTAQAAPVVFENLNGTDVVLHPSQSFTYYYINNTIHSLTDVVIESHYITISSIPIEVYASAETNVYINSFKPEHATVENATIANFTILPTYSDTSVHVYLGNLSELPLIVYKDGDPFFIGVASTFHSFEGNITTINSSDCFYFADGIYVAQSLDASDVDISDLSQGFVTVRATVVGIAYDAGTTTITLSDGTGTVNASFAQQIAIETGKEIVVYGQYVDGVIKASQIWLKMPSEFSAHTYEIKVLAPATVPIVTTPVEEEEGVGYAPPEGGWMSPGWIVTTLEPTIEYVSYTLAGLLLLLLILFIIRRLKKEEEEE